MVFFIYFIQLGFSINQAVSNFYLLFFSKMGYLKIFYYHTGLNLLVNAFSEVNLFLKSEFN